MPINPLSSVSMGGAAGDLGLSQQAQDEAKAMADKLKKKKLEDDKMSNMTGIQQGAAPGLGAASALFGGVL